MITVSDRLREAADLLERDGWCQGDLRDPNGRHCVMGALFDSNEYVAYDVMDARDVLETYVEEFATDWNDKDGQTAEEVIDALRGAADKWEEVNNALDCL